MLLMTNDEKVEQMPVNPDALRARFEGEVNYPVYRDFCSFFVCGVVGIRRFDKNKCHKPYTEYTSISDEAFTVLTLENNWSRWSSMAESDNWKESDVPSEWTTSTDKRKLNQQGKENDEEEETNKPQARRYRGWSAKGIARYNQLFNEIETERKKPEYVEFESYCMREFQEEAEEQGRSKNKRQKTRIDMPLPVAKHELFKNSDNQEVDEEEVNRQVPIAFRDLVENV
jgi:hypothetical protein